jgi:flagellar biosynthesis protein FlhF
MNLKRFTARTSRDALAMVRQAFGDDAVVMSTRPCAEGVEVLAMAPESVEQIERVGLTAEPAVRRKPLSGLAARAAQLAGEHAAERPHERQAERQAERPVDRMVERTVERTPERTADRRGERIEPHLDADDVAQDVEQMEMSTLSFQDYVRQRMLKRREAELAAAAAAPPAPPAPPPVVAPIEAARARHATRRDAAATAPAPTPMSTPMPRREVPVLRDEVRLPEPAAASVAAPPALRGQALAPAGDAAMLSELRSMRGLIEQRFGALAFMEKLQRQPRQAHLAQRLLDAGFSPALIRKLVESLPAEGDEAAWTQGVLERNLVTGEREPALEDVGGVYALIGATGVGKTTSTAKLAAAFATRHGAGNLGLITLDAYRVGAHEQLRTYGRILGVPVHTAHDRASLEDLLDLLSAKRMILIDTAGMAQRDSRTRELLEMLSHRAINRLLVVNASAQGETVEDQLAAYAAPSCRGLILSKLDEAVKLGPALDSMIRHKLKVVAVANGQRVPEDWHRLSANALVQRALKGGGGPAWRLDDSDVSLIFAGLPLSPSAPSGPVAAGAAMLA